MSSLTAQVAALQDQVGLLQAQVALLQGDLDEIDGSLEALEAAWRVEYNDSAFAIAGQSAAQRVQSLVTAIGELNNGQQQALFTELGGNKNAH